MQEIAKLLLQFLDKLAGAADTSMKERSNLTVNKSLKNSSKAIKAANKALDLANAYTDWMSVKDAKDFKRFKKDFDNNIGGK